MKDVRTLLSGLTLAGGESRGQTLVDSMVSAVLEVAQVTKREEGPWPRRGGREGFRGRGHLKGALGREPELGCLRGWLRQSWRGRRDCGGGCWDQDDHHPTIEGHSAAGGGRER